MNNLLLLYGPVWNAVFAALRVVHITGGTFALILGPLAMAATRRGRWHHIWGRAYVAAMGLVGVTAVPLALRGGNQFLFLIALFSFYLAWSGWRVMRRAKAARQSNAPMPPLHRVAEGIAPVTMISVVLILVTTGVQALQKGATFGAVWVVFGSVGGILALLELRDLLVLPKRNNTRFLAGHIARTLAAYTAALTAFSAVNLRGVGPLIVWLWPTAVMVPLTLLTIRRHQKSQIAAQLGVSTATSPAQTLL